jgi:opacity protein-like surface antigen
MQRVSIANRDKLINVLTVLFISAYSSVTVSAESKTLELYVGAYFPDAETTLRFDSEEFGQGSNITLEEDLNIESSKTLTAITGTYRFSKRSAFEFGYFDLSRNGSTTIDTEIEFGDQTFSINTQVNSEFNAEVYRLAYRYDLLHSGNLNISGLLGVHATDFDVSLEAEGIDDASERLTSLIPVPFVGVYSEYVFTKQLRLVAQIEYMNLEISDVKGGITNSLVGLDYQFLDNVGVRLGYSYFQIDGESDDFSRRFSGLVDYRYRGPTIFISTGF